MSKQRFFKSIQNDLHIEIAKIVLRKQGNKCFRCGVKNGSTVHKLSSGEYNEVDDHEANFMRNAGVKILKIHLRVIQENGNENSHDPNDYRALCPHHSQIALKEKIIQIKKKNIGDLSNIRVKQIVEVKNFIFNCTGKMIVTKDCIALIMRIEQVLKKK